LSAHVALKVDLSLCLRASLALFAACRSSHQISKNLAGWMSEEIPEISGGSRNFERVFQLDRKASPAWQKGQSSLRWKPKEKGHNQIVYTERQAELVTELLNQHTVHSSKQCLLFARDQPIMLISLPIMLCCTAKKSTYYAYINAQC